MENTAPEIGLEHKDWYYFLSLSRFFIALKRNKQNEESHHTYNNQCGSTGKDLTKRHTNDSSLCL